MLNVINESESARLDELTSYNSSILNHLNGETLDKALAGLVKRHARTDAALRQAALDMVHPDDLVFALVRAGHTLASFGISGVTRG